MTLHVPYRFAPVARKIYTPAWGPFVRHDVPFKDGLSGEIEIEITAKTPLIVGGYRRPASERRAGHVWPAALAHRNAQEQTYIIPGSSLQGMCRSILETATFARLGPFVDDQRFGVRDLVDKAKYFYQGRINATKSIRNQPMEVRPNVKAGWLRKAPVGNGYQLARCKYARIEFHDLHSLTCIPESKLFSRSEADARYAYFEDSVLKGSLRQTLEVDKDEIFYGHRRKNGICELKIFYRLAAPLPGKQSEPQNGYIVLTGNAAPFEPEKHKRSKNSHKPHPPYKHMEFFFYDPEEPVDLPSSFQEVFDAFASIHAESPGRKANPNWEYFYKTGYPLDPLTGESGKSFKDGGWMPIFYLEEKDDDKKDRIIETFGLAFMFKAAHKWTTHDMLAHTNIQHLPASSPHNKKSRNQQPLPAMDQKPSVATELLDLPSLIFGCAVDEKLKDEAAAAFFKDIKRRVTFEPAVLEEAQGLWNDDRPMILLSPKANYYPGYVRQKQANIAKSYASFTQLFNLTDQDNDLKTATYEAPEIAGVKLWYMTDREPIPSFGNNEQRAISSRITALATGSRFRTKLRFHNLRPVELGAVLWALTYGQFEVAEGEPRPRHRLGMAKPYGFGEIEIQIANCSFHSTQKATQGNAPAEKPQVMLKKHLNDFVAHMDKVCQRMMGDQAPSREWQNCAQVKALLAAATPGGVAFEQHGFYPANGYLQYAAFKKSGRALLPLGVTGSEIPGGWEFPR